MHITDMWERDLLLFDYKEKVQYNGHSGTVPRTDELLPTFRK